MKKKINPRKPASLQLYTVGETAAILGVSRRSVTNWIKQDALPAIRLGPGQRLLRVRQADLEAFITNSNLKPPHMRTPYVNDDPHGIAEEDDLVDEAEEQMAAEQAAAEMEEEDEYTIYL